MNYENPSLAKEVNLKMIRSLIVFADMIITTTVINIFAYPTEDHHYRLDRHVYELYKKQQRNGSHLYTECDAFQPLNGLGRRKLDLFCFDGVVDHSNLLTILLTNKILSIFLSWKPTL